MKTIDRKGELCECCGRGTYSETNQLDDLRGVLHCWKCGDEVQRHYTEEESMDKYHWNWGNFDYNKGYNDGLQKSVNIVKGKDEEIAQLKKRLKEFIDEK